MNPFNYLRVSQEKDAIDAATKTPEAAYLAGGTNVVDYMKEGAFRPSTLIDIRRLPFEQIEEHGGGLRLGSLATNSAVAYHPVVQKRYPMLSEALLSGASPQLRNVATVGGNILQRTRCIYFRDTAFGCNKREPGTGCPAYDGYNRMHAILGGSEQCIATHASDMCVALAALDAIIQTSGPQGRRDIPFRDFYREPGNTPQVENVLGPSELIVAVDLPPLPFARRSGYFKVRDRASYEFALASAAVALDLDGDKIIAARVALGGIGTKPWRSLAAEETLVGASVDKNAFRTAAEMALQGAQPRQYNAFKIELAKRTLVQALDAVSKKEVST